VYRASRLDSGSCERRADAFALVNNELCESDNDDDDDDEDDEDDEEDGTEGTWSAETLRGGRIRGLSAKVGSLAMKFGNSEKREESELSSTLTFFARYCADESITRRGETTRRGERK